MTAVRLVLPLLTALCLSACAARPAQEAIGRYPATASEGGEGPALAALPAVAGRVVAMRRVLHANGVSQQIVIEGPRTMAGENRITVEALTTAETGGGAGRGDELKLGVPSRAEISAEMEREIPGMAMSIAAAPEHDGQGPFGYATGSSGRLSCVFAWQYLAPNRPVSLLEGATGTGVLPMSVRVRLCRERPVAALVEDLRGLTVARPDEGPAAVGAPAGDALDAALSKVAGTGPRNPAQFQDDATQDCVRFPTRSCSGPLASAPVGEARVTTAEPARSPPHRRLRPVGSVAPAPRRPAAPPRRSPPRGAEHHRPARSDGDVAARPRLPMPGDVAVAGPASPRPSVATPPSERAGTAAGDGLPLPR